MNVLAMENGFKVLLDGKQIISHTPESPCLFAGRGAAAYDMYRGNFEITENLFEKVALTDCTLETGGDQTLVTLSRQGLYPVKLSFGRKHGRAVISFVDASQDVNRIWLRLDAQPEEKVYGCGEQFSHFNLRGRHFPLWTSEQGVGRNKKTEITFMADRDDRAGGDYYTTYFPQPTFVSTRKYYCHVDGSAYMDFDFRNDQYHELGIWQIPREIVFESADTYIELVQKLTLLLGRQPELPEWVYNGVWIGVQGGTQVCLDKLKKAREKGLQVGAIWAQDWEGKRITSFGSRLMWNWQWDQKLYPELDKAISELKEHGVRFLGYINPYLAVDGPLYKEGRQKGYMAKTPDGKDSVVDFGEFDCGFPDFTHPEAAQWYKDRVIKQEMIDFGLAGWMADFAEYNPVDLVYNNGVDGEFMHNLWPAIWAKINREAVEEAGKLDDVTFFMRAGFTGSQQYCTMIWAGDQNVDWSLDDGLASVIPAALSLAMCGFGLHHSCTGGYTTLYDMKRTKELFLRWAELSAFTPVMRTHEGNRPAANWQYDSDDDTLIAFARLSHIYTTLAPYTRAMVAENAKAGIPLMRPLFLHYEDDPQVYELQYQYLYGPDLLVAPVYEPGKGEWQVYLPKDRWIHLWSGKFFDGGSIKIPAPLGRPPVFYRETSTWKTLFERLGKL